MNTKLQKNVWGMELEPCCKDPITGYYRDGYCQTDPTDQGEHTICVVMTDAFLTFGKEMGNDLITPRPEFSFPGLKAGDCWCVCASRWMEAYEAGVAPKINLKATHEDMLQYISLSELKKYDIS